MNQWIWVCSCAEKSPVFDDFEEAELQRMFHARKEGHDAQVMPYLSRDPFDIVYDAIAHALKPVKLTRSQADKLIALIIKGME